MYNDREHTLEEKKQMVRTSLMYASERDKIGLTKIVQLDLLKELAFNLSNLSSVTKDQWQVTITKLKNYKRVFNVKGDTFGKFIDKLLPLLGAYLGAMFTFKENKENDIEAGTPEVQNPVTGEMTDTPEKYLKVMNMRKGKRPKQYVLDWCKEEKYGFSFYLKNENLENEASNQTDTDCVLSLCPPTENTDTSTLNNNSTLRDSRGIIVEYDSEYPHIINVQPGMAISFNEDIGRIKDLPVKSQVRGIVVKKTSKYFIADYIDEMPEIDVDELIAKYDNKPMEELCNLFRDNANVTNFIKDYILETRIPSLANHLREHLLGTVNEVSSAKYLKKYRKKAEKIQKKYGKKVKKACDKKTVEAYGKKSKLHKLKEKLDEYKVEAFNQILDLYNNYKSLGYCSKGRIADYMLYDEYLDFLMDEEKFRYDDANPYVVKMFKLLCKFIGTRSRIENNLENIPSLIDKFNKLCKKSIRKYWKPRNNDYYTEMKSIFRYEYYTNDTENLIEAAVTDKDAVSMYSKTYDYLKALCHYTVPASQSIQYTDNIDVEAILNSGMEDKTDRTMNSDLRKIAFNFCLLRNVETSAADESIYNTIANRSIVTAFYYLHLIAGILIESYDEDYVGIDPIILASRSILRPYLKTLKKMTQSEAFEMDKLAKEAIQWYRDNGEKVNDPRIYDKFKEVPWGSRSKIVYNNEYYDYTFLKYEMNDASTMLKKAEPFDFDTQDTSDEYYNTLKFMNSAYGPNTFLYWLRYLAIATIVNCMLPIYWGTGIIIAGAPIILPIIMLPFFVLPGRVTVVFGIGLCGVCPMPLILFVNLSNTKGTILIPLNILADTLKASLKQAANMAQKKMLTLSFTPAIKALDDRINGYNAELDALDDQIHNLDSFIKNNKSVVRNIKKRKNEDPTTQPE